MSWTDDNDLFDTAHDGPEQEEEDVEVEWSDVKVSTDKAMLVVIDGEETWLPKSQMSCVERTGGRFSKAGRCLVPAWLAVEKNLV